MNVFKVKRSASKNLRAMLQSGQGLGRSPLVPQPDPSSPVVTSSTDDASISRPWKRVGQAVCHQLWRLLLSDDQPQVKWWRDRQGHDHYQVDDPVSRSTYQFKTAQEVRVWLEQRYYR